MSNIAPPQQRYWKERYREMLEMPSEKAYGVAVEKDASAMNVTDIERMALAELSAEEQRAAVNAAKERIRARRGRPWFKKLFPYQITIRRV